MNDKLSLGPFSLSGVAASIGRGLEKAKGLIVRSIRGSQDPKTIENTDSQRNAINKETKVEGGRTFIATQFASLQSKAKSLFSAKVVPQETVSANDKKQEQIEKELDYLENNIAHCKSEMEFNSLRSQFLKLKRDVGSSNLTEKLGGQIKKLEGMFNEHDIGVKNRQESVDRVHSQLNNEIPKLRQDILGKTDAPDRLKARVELLRQKYEVGFKEECDKLTSLPQSYRDAARELNPQITILEKLV